MSGAILSQVRTVKGNWYRTLNLLFHRHRVIENWYHISAVGIFGFTWSMCKVEFPSYRLIGISPVGRNGSPEHRLGNAKVNGVSLLNYSET